MSQTKPRAQCIPPEHLSHGNMVNHFSWSLTWMWVTVIKLSHDLRPIKCLRKAQREINKVPCSYSTRVYVEEIQSKSKTPNLAQNWFVSQCRCCCSHLMREDRCHNRKCVTTHLILFRWSRWLKSKSTLRYSEITYFSSWRKECSILSNVFSKRGWGTRTKRRDHRHHEEVHIWWRRRMVKLSLFCVLSEAKDADASNRALNAQSQSHLPFSANLLWEPGKAHRGSLDKFLGPWSGRQQFLCHILK